MTDIKIMIVEDESIIAKNIQIMINKLGYHVTSIESTGTGAIRKAKLAQPDLILMDIILKGKMDGIEASRRIRRNLDTAIVYLTAYADQETLKRAKLTEPFGYITKPFEIKELHSTIEMALYRHKMEKKCRENEERFKILFEHAPDAYYLCDLKGTFIDGNRAAEMLIGYKKEELIGKSFLNLKLLSPAQILKAAKLLEKNATNKPTGPDEFVLNRKNGKQVHVEVRTHPVKIRGKIHILGIARDITNRKLAEEALRKSEEKYKILFEESPIIHMVLGKNGKILDINQIAIKRSGYSKEELIGKKVVDFVVPEHKEKVIAQMEKDFKGEKTSEMEVNIMNKAGLIRTYLFTSEKIFLNGKENPTGVLVNGIDITERKKAEKEIMWTTTELKKYVKELEQFTHISAHDLQEPLRMVVSYVELLKKRYADKLDSEAVEFIGFAVDGANRMKKLLNDLLAYSRLNIRGNPFVLTESTSIIKEVINRLQPLIEHNHAIISYNELPKIQVDPIQFRELFKALIDNAIKFRNIEPPMIQIGAKKDQEHWLFSVKDNGIGIHPKYHDKVFMIFQRLHSHGEYTGTGVGLALCKKIIERHNGQIWIESKPGKGSTFFFTVPIKNENTAIPIDLN